MHVPEKMQIELLAAKAVDLSGVIAQLTVKSGHKNPYYIYFPKTDELGRATLLGSDFIGQFDDHHEMALMDYAGTIEDASPIVKVSLFDPKWCRENPRSAKAYPLLRNEVGKWSSRDEEYEYMISCRNDLFTAKPIKVNIEEEPNVELKVRT